MIVAQGIQNVMALMTGDAAGKKWASIAVGTSAVPVTGAETALENQVTKSILTFNDLGGGVVQFNAQLDAGDPEMVINEIGLLNNSGLLGYRQVITPQNKVAGGVYSLSYKIKIQ